MIQYDTEGQVQPQELLRFYNTTLWEEKEKYRKKNCRQKFLITLMIANEFSKLAKYSLLKIEPTVTSECLNSFSPLPAKPLLYIFYFYL